MNFLTIQLNIEGESSLMILLHSDGTINRIGNGTMEIDKNFYIGMTDTAPILDQLSKLMDDDFKQYINHVYDLPEKSGKNCFVEIVMGIDSQTQGMKFMYGSESMGPPRPVSSFVMKAVELTDPWFKQQQKQAKKANKKWWEFWK